MNTRSSGATALLALLLLAGCSTTVEGDGSAADGPATAEQSPHDHIEDPEPVPTYEAGQRTAGDLTVAAMTAYIDQSLTAEAWYEQLAGYLSPQAQQDYYGTDPAEVLARQLVGPPTVVSETEFLADVEQGTDAGVYTVLLSVAADGGWQVERITPPRVAG